VLIVREELVLADPNSRREMTTIEDENVMAKLDCFVVEIFVGGIRLLPNERNLETMVENQ
jgi:hypothetical protein